MRARLLSVVAVLVAVMAPTARAQSAQPAIEISPERFVLGVQSSAELLVHGLEKHADLRFAASSGTLTAVAELRGVYALRWVPPEVRYPAWVVLLVWDARDREGRVAVARVPLWGRTELEMSTEPNAEVRVEVGGQSFGPVRADARGRVQVPIEVPPGVKGAQVIATAPGGRQLTRTVPLEVPRTRPFAVALGPEPMPPSGGWLVAAVAGEDGARVAANAQGASLERAPGGEGVSRYEVRPEAGAAEVAVSVAVGEAEPRRARVEVGERPPETEREARRRSRRALGGRDDEGAVSLQPREGQWPVHALVGTYVAGGANAGVALEAGVGRVLPLWDGRVAAELNLGLRTGGFEGAARLGRLESTLIAVPVTLSGRALIFSSGPFSLHARGGGGAVPYQQTIRAEFQPRASVLGLGYELFAAAQASILAGPVEVIAEGRGAWARVRSPQLEATPGGFTGSVGVRWTGGR